MDQTFIGEKLLGVNLAIYIVTLVTIIFIALIIVVLIIHFIALTCIMLGLLVAAGLRGANCPGR